MAAEEERREETEEQEREEKKQKGRVNDPEEAGQQARIRAIQRALQEAIDRRTASEDSVLAGGASHQDRLRYYRTGVEQFLLQIASLAERAEASEYWDEEDIGTVVIPLPPEIQEVIDDPQVRIPWGVERPEPKALRVVGLSGFLTHRWPHTEVFSVPTGRTDTVTAEATVEPPLEVIDSALVTALRFLGETGLDIEVSETEHRTVVDEEILEETEKWRKQNLP